MARIAALCLALIVGTLSFSFADGFKDFLKEQQTEFSRTQGDFDSYREDTEQSYRAYRKVVLEEYAKFREQISQYWESAEIGDRKKWVEYSKDLQTRKIVDFEKKVIEIDIIVPEKRKNLDEKINAILTDLLLEDKRTAIKRDPLLGNIEKRIKKDTKKATPDKIEKTPILTTVITGTPTPTKGQVKQAVMELRNNETIDTRSSKVKNKEVVSLKIPLPSDLPVKKANEIKPDVTYYASKRGIDDALVFAVIHTESAFNPMARSPVPAYGLMQIVPQSAGLDATKLVFGRQVLLSPTYLYNSKNNINMGTTYLYILFYKYLKNIEDPKSRLYCSIAAYNTGAGNVARAFVGSANIGKAVRVINRKSPEAVYKRLMRKLPYSETKQYLSKVSKRLEIYR